MKVIKSYVDELMYKRIHPSEIIEDERPYFKIGFKYKIEPEYTDIYLIAFDFYVPKVTQRSLNVKYHIMIKNNDIIDESFTKSKKIKKESLSLAYPYLKSFIISYFNMSGLPPIELPDINDILSSNSENNDF